MRRIATSVLLLAAAFAARAAPVEVCDLPPRYGVGPAAAQVVRVACQEHRLWLRPFIEADGRLAALAVTEAERGPLDDGSTPAWQRVAQYWRESGTLAAMAAAGTPGAAACMALDGRRETENDCRAFLLDQPWSAAFVSWVMMRAGLPGFVASPRHLDYITHAWRHPDRGPYVYADPWTARPAPGDLLCFLRGADDGLGAAGLRAALAGAPPPALRSHCEIVVAANPGGDRTLHLVGGNVLNAVVMRKLPLDRTGRLDAAALAPVAGGERMETDATGAAASVAAPSPATAPAAATAGAASPATGAARMPATASPQGSVAATATAATAAQPATSRPVPSPTATGPAPVAHPAPGTTVAPASPPPPMPANGIAGDAAPADACSPGNAPACSFNRRDWAVLLQLKPQAAPPVRTPAVPATPATPATPAAPGTPGSPATPTPSDTPSAAPAPAASGTSR